MSEDAKDISLCHSFFIFPFSSLPSPPISFSPPPSLLFYLAISFCETPGSEVLLYSKYHCELFVRHSPHHIALEWSERGWKKAWNRSRTSYMRRNASETNEQSAYIWPDRINLVDPCYNFQIISGIRRTTPKRYLDWYNCTGCPEGTQIQSPQLT